MGASRTRVAVLAIMATAGCAAIVAFRWQMPAPVPPVLGMVRQTEIRIAPETTGRLASIAVKPGQPVRKGDVLAVIDNPELAATVGEAVAAAAGVKAERDRVYSGVRAEETAIAAENVRRAEANLLLARQQNNRAATLAARNVASKQQADESAASLAKAQADLDLQRARSTAAKAGPTTEERALADAKLTLSAATVADIRAQYGKTTLVASADGTIGIRIAEPGEIVSPGKPVMTMTVEGARWFAFTLREDLLPGLAIGKTVAVTATDGRRIDARITELRPLGEFATWRAARAVGDHDLNSFRLRLDPLVGDDRLQPGMTVWLSNPG